LFKYELQFLNQTITKRGKRTFPSYCAVY